MDLKDEGKQQFEQVWAGALERVCELVTSFKIKVGGDDGDSGLVFDPDQDQDSMWWEQAITVGERPFPVIIGAPRATWMRIAFLLEPGQGDDSARLAFGDLLSQVAIAAAEEIGNRLGQKAAAGPGKIREVPPSPEFLIGTAAVSLEGDRLPAITIALDRGLAAQLAGEKAPTAPAVPAARQNPALDVALERLVDLELPLSVVLGRASLPLRDVLRITPGSMIELGRQIGDPVELVVEDAVVARGEVVAVRGNYGVRIHQLIGRSERMMLQRAARPSSSAVVE